jgi:VWFA-related protein
MRHTWILGGLLLLHAAPLDPAQTTIRTNVNLVQLSVRVTGSDGKNVVGLPREAFRLLIDKKDHPITVFNGEDAPVTAGIVIDNSGSMAPKREVVSAAAVAFARASNTSDQMFVVHFNQHARLGLPGCIPFTGSIPELEKAISTTTLGGSTALYDAILLAQSHFQRGAYGRKILLVITDGGDNSSDATLSQTLDAVAKAGIVIYSIGIFDENDRDRNPEVLAQLAAVTGGESFLPAAVSETTKICEQIAADVRRQYTLGFAGAEDGQFHKIEVLASDSEHGVMQVHTQPDYFAAKPKNSANRGSANRRSKR